MLISIYYKSNQNFLIFVVEFFALQNYNVNVLIKILLQFLKLY